MRLQRDVSGEPVGDDHVGCLGEQVAALGVPAEVEARSPASRACASSVSWFPFSASSPIESSRTWGRATPRISSAKIDAHVRELEQVLRARVGVRAAVEQHGGAVAGGDRHGDRGRWRHRGPGGSPADRPRASRPCSRPKRRRRQCPAAMARHEATSELSGFERTASAGFSSIAIDLFRDDVLEPARVQRGRAEDDRRRSRPRSRERARRRPRPGPGRRPSRRRPHGWSCASRGVWRAARPRGPCTSCSSGTRDAAASAGRRSGRR